jgi:hypothetical protein
LALTASVVRAAGTDLVPVGSVLRDALARLAVDGLLGKDADANLLLTDPVITRDHAARLLENAGLTGSSANSGMHPNDAAALRRAVNELRPELTMDKIDVPALLRSLPNGGAAFTGQVEPEGRFRAGGDSSDKSYAIGIYRATLQGGIGRDGSFAVSASDWPEDARRVFDNNKGPHDFNALNEAYVQAQGKKGFVFTAGRVYDRWGPGVRGTTLLSDNAPAIDQLKIEFPFSFGRVFGRNWRYTQMAGTFQEDSGTKYLQARRIEYAFNRRLIADYEESLKSSSSRELILAPVPFLIGKGFSLSNFDTTSNYNGNLGLSYSANDVLRLYGQFFIDDAKSPFRGKFLGFSLGSGTDTPRKIAYLVGGTIQTPRGTTATLEYTLADPTTYLFQNSNAESTAGAYDFLGLPTGANERELSGLLSQRFGSLTLGVEGRDQRRDSNSFPAPSARYYTASASYRVDRRQSVGFAYQYYRQTPYLYYPGTPGYPTSGFTPVQLGDQGRSLNIKEVDVSYKLAF